MINGSSLESQFEYAKIREADGVLEITLHTEGGTLQWNQATHREMPKLFRAVSELESVKVVILTGSGDTFTGPRLPDAPTNPARREMSAEAWDEFLFDGRRIILDLLNIEVPIIAAINGPAWRHMELALLSDIVLASETAQFEDRAHLTAGNLMPGDGMHLLLSELIGWNRARYMQLVGQTLSAKEAMELGLVSEVLPKEQVLDRAWDLASGLASKERLLLRYTRLLFVQEMKKRMHDHLALGLSLEGLALLAGR
jgi:enoyl-CoA hydratase/carnithine racemase